MGSEALEQAIKTGKIPYRYEYDIWSGLYFGLAILFVIFLYAAAQAVTQKLLQ
jgi:hypothetical protein